MLEGYRRTIGAPYLVEAVFMATPPEALQESLAFMLGNNAQTLPRMVRRWSEAHPDAAGRIDVDPRVLKRMRADSNPGLSLAGTILERLHDSAPPPTPPGDASAYFSLDVD